MINLIPKELEDDDSFKLLVEQLGEQIGAIESGARELIKAYEGLQKQKAALDEGALRVESLHAAYLKIVSEKAPDFEAQALDQLTGMDQVARAYEDHAQAIEKVKEALKPIRDSSKNTSSRVAFNAIQQGMMGMIGIGGAGIGAMSGSLPDSVKFKPRDKDHPAERAKRGE